MWATACRVSVNVLWGSPLSAECDRSNSLWPLSCGRPEIFCVRNPVADCYSTTLVLTINMGRYWLDLPIINSARHPLMISSLPNAVKVTKSTNFFVYLHPNKQLRFSILIINSLICK